MVAQIRAGMKGRKIHSAALRSPTMNNTERVVRGRSKCLRGVLMGSNPVAGNDRHCGLVAGVPSPLPGRVSAGRGGGSGVGAPTSCTARSEEHTSELQS